MQHFWVQLLLHILFPTVIFVARKFYFLFGYFNSNQKIRSKWKYNRKIAKN